MPRTPDPQSLQPASWKVSLHGGHSKAFCDHASSTLEEMVRAAIDFGYVVFGITEHAPRIEPERLYSEEMEMGWTVETLDGLFTSYAAEVDRLADSYKEKITLLKGFESEVVPEGRYGEAMRDYRRRLCFDYVVGSVHWVAGHIIDYTPLHWAAAQEACGGTEGLAVRYYRTLAEMVETLSPEVVGHFDLVRLGFTDDESAATPAIMKAALEALETIRHHGAILDVNTGGYRKGLGHPFPAPAYVQAARDMGIAMCMGDDSHAARQVGAGIVEARHYLLKQGITRITTLAPGMSGLNRAEISLEPYSS